MVTLEEKSVLLATGSAEPYAYLYNIGEVNEDENIGFQLCMHLLTINYSSELG
jgi:hypothetical protein